jgi:hypothetical protein
MAQGKLAVFEDAARIDAPSQGSSVQNAHEFGVRFPFQSYFDSTLLEKALLKQAPNQALVSSGLSEKELKKQVAGFALAVHPLSEAPAAVQFFGGKGGRSASAPMVLKPGEIIRPTGMDASGGGAFQGFQVGLPFGWLGGGLVRFRVLPSPDASVSWGDTQNEVIIHRTRMKIVAPSAMPAVAYFPCNWPLRFPWRYAISDTNSQGGTPTLTVTPTRTVMRLRKASLTQAATMRVYVLGARDFDAELVSSPTLPVSMMEMFWADYSAAPAGYAGYPTIEAPFALTRMGCDESSAAVDRAGIQLVSDSVDLQGAFVDVIRYGRL